MLVSVWYLAVQRGQAHRPLLVANGPQVVSKCWQLAEAKHEGDCVGAPVNKAVVSCTVELAVAGVLTSKMPSTDLRRPS